MRGLVYAIKDSRTPPNPKQLIDHPPIKRISAQNVSASATPGVTELWVFSAVGIITTS
jgi:hypothetical protein